MKQGDWLFTCKMYPVQFLEYINNGDFRTADKSEHSIDHCGCNPVSKKYALWFLKNKIWEAHDDLSDYSKLSPFKRIDKNHYIRIQGNLEFHYVGERPIKKDRHSNSYMKRFYQRWLIYKGFRLELGDKYDVWDVYKQYIEKRCESENIKYEGY